MTGLVDAQLTSQLAHVAMSGSDRDLLLPGLEALARGHASFASPLPMSFAQALSRGRSGALNDPRPP